MTTAVVDETKAAADAAAKLAADKTAADVAAAAEKATADKAAADKVAADKAAADTAAADAAAAGKTPEQIAAEKAAAETELARKAADEAKARENYDLLTLPEKSPLTTVDLDELKADAKALALTTEQAQTLVRLRHELVTNALAQAAKEYGDLKADPVLGGANFETTQKHAEMGLKWMFDGDEPAARAFFEQFGLDNNKVLVKGLAKLGKATAEDTPIAGSASTKKAEKTPEEVLYGPAK
jgi:hypothetical protein